MTPTQVRLQMLDNGWRPVPVRGKAPAVPEWQRFCRSDPTTDDIESWERYPDAVSTGIALGRQVAVDIDVLSDPILAQRIRAEAVACFGQTPFVRVGQAPKVALIYRAAEPIRTVRFKAASGNGDGVDILSDGSQFVAFGIHPTTGRLFQWIGETSPLDATPDDATPAITEGQIAEFLDRVHLWMPLGGGGTSTGKRPAGTGTTQAIIRGPSGLVIDGRESFMTACVWTAAGQVDAAGEPLTLETVAAIAWQAFTSPIDGADLSDGRWTEKNALHKARSTLRRLADGTVSLRKSEPAVGPTYPDHAETVEAARGAVEHAIRRHMLAAGAYHAEGDKDAEPPVHALRVATGVGKTSIAARLIAEHRKANGKGQPFLFAVPTHRLGDEIETQFREHGVTARVFRGRSAQDPDRPGSTMCDDMEAVEIALGLGVTVETGCCRSKDPTTKTIRQCVFYETCSYQGQKAVRPDVWIVAHQLLFAAQAALGEVAGVFIDESFWQAGMWTARRGLTLEEIEAALIPGPNLDAQADLEPLRIVLARALRRQSAIGGVERRHLIEEGLTVDGCTAAIALEWTLKDRPAIWPGMPPVERRRAAKAAKSAKHIRGFDRTWRAARELLRQEQTDAVSGRLFLADSETDHGVCRVVQTQGVKDIAKQWRAPTLIMDATLPDVEILKVFYPGVEVLADVDATLPHVEIRQIVGAPVSARKLDVPLNRNAVRRAILHRHLELGRAPTLVIAQKAVAKWLRASGLPAGIAVEHFNNVAGIDRYKDVRLLITVGRTLPSVFDVEAMAGALTGLEPVKTAQPESGPRWFDRATRGIRLKNGAGVGVTSDQHPDPMAEAVRWQICEGGLIQAIGRARGVNRTVATPLAIDVVTDVVLPVTVGHVLPWNEVLIGAEVEMLAEGVWIESPTDMAACWPDVWATEKAAEHWRARFTAPQNPIEDTLYRVLGACGRYQLPGARQKWRTARFDLSIVPDPKAWLTKRLDVLAGFELTFPHPELDVLNRLFDQAAEAVRVSPQAKGRTHDQRNPTAGMGCVEVSATEPSHLCRDHPWTRWHGLRMGSRVAEGSHLKRDAEISAGAE